MIRTGVFILLTCLCFQIAAQTETEDPIEEKGKKEQVEPIDGWAIKEYHTKEELKQIRKDKWAELAAWEDEHFTTPKGRWYFGIRGGYTIPFLTIANSSPKSYLGTASLFIGDDGSVHNEGLYAANSRGSRYGINVGYMFNNYIGLEADIGYNHYNKIVLGRNNTPTYKSELETWSNDLSFMPQLVFNTPNIRNFYFYAKVGFFVPFWGGTTGHAFVDDYSGKFLKDLAGSPASGFITLIDLIAIELGETVDGLGFLEEGVFNALGYHLTLDTDLTIKLRPDVDALGFTATLGGRYQISPLVSLSAEMRVAGYNISTLETTLNELTLNASLLGNRDFVQITEEGGHIANTLVDVEQLEFLLVTEYVYELTEESNHPLYNPNGQDPTKPAQELADRKSTMGFTMGVGVQFNFGGRRQNKAAE